MVFLNDGANGRYVRLFAKMFTFLDPSCEAAEGSGEAAPKSATSELKLVKTPSVQEGHNDHPTPSCCVAWKQGRNVCWGRWPAGTWARGGIWGSRVGEPGAHEALCTQHLCDSCQFAAPAQPRLSYEFLTKPLFFRLTGTGAASFAHLRGAPVSLSPVCTE